MARPGKPPSDEDIPLREGGRSSGDELSWRVGNSSARSTLSPFSHFFNLSLNLFSRARPLDSSSPHSLFPATELPDLAAPPTRSRSEDEAERWLIRTLIVFCGPVTPGPPAEGRSFGTTGGVTPKIMVVGLSTGDVFLDIGPTLLCRTDWSRAGYQ